MLDPPVISETGKSTRNPLAGLHARNRVPGPIPHVHHVCVGKQAERPVIAKAARMLEQVADPDWCAIVGKLRHVAAHIVVEGKPGPLSQQQHSERRERLRGRAEIECRPRCDRPARFSTCDTLTSR